MLLIELRIVGWEGWGGCCIPFSGFPPFSSSPRHHSFPRPQILPRVRPRALEESYMSRLRKRSWNWATAQRVQNQVFSPKSTGGLTENLFISKWHNSQRQMKNLFQNSSLWHVEDNSEKHRMELNDIRNYVLSVDIEEVHYDEMCRFHIHIFIVRPVWAVRPSSVTDDLRGKGGCYAILVSVTVTFQNITPSLSSCQLLVNVELEHH